MVHSEKKAKIIIRQIEPIIIDAIPQGDSSTVVMWNGIIETIKKE